MSNTTDYRSLTAGRAAGADDRAYQFPTAQAVFGSETEGPWIKNPTGTETNTNQTYSFNPYYFATPAAAQKLADMIGGKVVEVQGALTPFGPFTQSHPNQLVELPDGRRFNAGLLISFWDHGYSQYWIDKLMENELRPEPAAT